MKRRPKSKAPLAVITLFFKRRFAKVSAYVEKKVKAHAPIIIATLSIAVGLVVVYIGIHPIINAPIDQDNPQLGYNSNETHLTTPDFLEAPFAVKEYYVPSGYMGDGQENRESIHVEVLENCNDREDSGDGHCTKVSYTPGEKHWGGSYWQHPHSNWGKYQGITIKNATRISFWAKGETGSEVVSFMAGGIDVLHYPHRDSFKADLGEIKLSQRWLRYDMDVSEMDLNNVIGGFAWTAADHDNPSGKITFYLDDIIYE